MSVTQIQTLLTPPNKDAADAKTLAYLNSHFNTFDDLNELDTLLETETAKKDTLTAQWSTSETELKEFLANTRRSLAEHVHTAQELSLLRHSLTDELAFLNDELLSSLSNRGLGPSLLEDIETQHRNLKELENIKGYVQVVALALQYKEASKAQMEKLDPSAPISAASISGYHQLHDFVEKVDTQCSQVEDATGQQTLNLVTFLRKTRSKAWSDIKQVLFAKLLSVVEPLGWPGAIDFKSATASVRKDFEDAFTNLLRLQDLKASFIPEPSTEKLYPLEALVQPVSLRFKFHFEGSRQTNRLDKPEWYFTHVLNVIHEHRDVMEGAIQRLLQSAKRKDSDAQREFTILLFPLLHRKLRATIPTLLAHPPLLAHTIYQAISFDATLKEQNFEPSPEDDFPDGISGVLLGNAQLFDTWLAGEKKFVDEQYEEMRQSREAWSLVDVESEREGDQFDTKVTNSARRVKSLVEQVTDRYSPLPSFSHRSKFFLSVQLPLLQRYYTQLGDSLDAFENITTRMLRGVPGALTVNFGSGEEGGVTLDARPIVSGVEGLQKLCKALLSAKYICKALSTWGEDLFFLELWTEMNNQSSLRSIVEESPMLPAPSPTVEGTIFDKLSGMYSQLSERAHEMVIQQVTSEVEQSLRAHFTAINSPDPSTTQPPSEESLSISPTLLRPISLLSTHLTFLRQTLEPSVVVTLYRSITSRLSEHILQRQILYRGGITREEGRNVLLECDLWLETCQGALAGTLGGGRNRVESPWLKFIEASRIVGSEGEDWDKIVSTTNGGLDDEAWEGEMFGLLGSSVLSREEVSRILRRRETHD